jgi:hypothetical protein
MHVLKQFEMIAQMAREGIERDTSVAFLSDWLPILPAHRMEHGIR